jgi:hypothetical protein
MKRNTRNRTNEENGKKDTLASIEKKKRKNGNRRQETFCIRQRSKRNKETISITSKRNSFWVQLRR